MVDFTEQSRRESKVLLIQRQIEEGSYDDSEEKLEAAIDNMLDTHDAQASEPSEPGDDLKRRKPR